MQLDATSRRRLEVQQQESGSLENGSSWAGGGVNCASVISAAGGASSITSPRGLACAMARSFAGSASHSLSTPQLHGLGSWPSECYGAVASSLLTSASMAECWGGCTSGSTAGFTSSSHGGAVVGERVSTGEALLARTASKTQLARPLSPSVASSADGSAAEAQSAEGMAEAHVEMALLHARSRHFRSSKPWRSYPLLLCSALLSSPL